MKITIEVPEQNGRELFEKCYQDGTTPAEVLGGFVADLVDGIGTRGSDERRLASEYYYRCGYYAEKETLTSWVLGNYGTEALEEIADNPEEALPGYYDNYCEYNADPESMTDALTGIVDYLEQIGKGAGRE